MERRHKAAPYREAERLAALRALRILDTPDDEAFDGIVRMAARLCTAPVALISLVDEHRLWFKARSGVSAREMPRGQSMCEIAMRLAPQDFLIVPDAAADARFAPHALVAGETGVRFYAGTPLTLRSGVALGTLCVMDRRPRELGAEQVEALSALAEQAVAEIELRASRDRFAARYRQALISAAPAAGDRVMEERLRGAFEHLRESIVLTDPEDRFVIANRAFRDLNQNVAHAIQPGQKFEDYIRAGLAAGNYPEAVGREQEWLEARLDERRNPGKPVERQRSGGRWFLIDDRRLPDGSTIRFGSEITDRKRAEAVLKERNRELQLVVDSVPVMITRLDRQERFQFVNRAYTEMMERPAEELLGRPIAEVIPAQAYARIKPALSRALAGDPVSVERVQRRSNGEVIEIEGRYIPDVDVQGRVVGLIAVHRDVTAERRARRSQLESEARFRSLTALSADWYWEQDAQFRYTFVSDDAEARGAVSSSARLGKTRWELPWFGVSEAQWAAHRAQLEAHQVFHDFEVGRPGEDGEATWVSVSGEPTFDERGRFTGYRGVTRNITQRKASEQLLRLEHQIARTLSEAADAATGVREVIKAICETQGWGCGRYFKLDEAAGLLRFEDGWCLPHPAFQRYLAQSHTLAYRPGEGLAGIAWQSGEPVWSPDTSRDPRVLSKALARNSNIRGAFVFAVVSQGKTLGVLSFSSQSVRAPNERWLQATRVIGSQIGQFLRRKQAERSLHESEARFRSLTALSSDWYWEQDEEFRFTYMSGDLARNTGVSSEDHIGRTRWEMPALNLSEDDWARHRAQLERHEPFRDFEMRRPDWEGRMHWVSISGEPVFGADGRFRGYRGVGRDITPRKVEEQARVASDALKSAMLASALDAIVSIDGEGCIIEFNPAAEQCFGWRRGEAVGRPVADLLVPPELRDLHRRSLEKMQRSDAAPLAGRRVEMPALRKDGSRITVEIAIVRLPNVAPAVYTAFLRDVTDRKRAQDALAESEARFRALFERSSAGMAITDASGLYLSVNAAFARFFGYAVDELVGRKRVQDLRMPSDSEGPALYARLIAGDIGFYERDQPYQRKDGARVWGRATVSAVRDVAGKPLYVVAVFTDITDEMAARERLRSMNIELEERVEHRTAELRAALKELDAFTYSVSHDLRAPVGAVSGFAHLLRKAEADRLSEDGNHLLGVIEQNAERMTRLIEGLLRFSRLGRSDLRRMRVSMNGLVGETLLDFVDAAAHATVNAASLPDCEGDPALLGQVWSNLVGNALKYSRGSRPPRVDIGWDPAKKAYYVRDNGVGFDMAYADKLFGVFERLHGESEFEGSGIGLAIAERIVRLHGGAIWAEAALGQGATFWFTVPAGADEIRSSPVLRR